MNFDGKLYGVPKREMESASFLQSSVRNGRRSHVYRNVNAANYPDSRPLTPLITTNAFDIFGHVLCRVSKFVPREFAGSPTGPSNERKKGEANQDDEGGGQ